MLKRYEETGTIRRREGSGRPTKITTAVKQLVERQMRADDETTAVQLYALCRQNDINISLATILRARTALGWTFRGSAYCQLIRDANKVKRLQWATANLQDTFHAVIWTDECSVQMESHRRHCCRKIGEAPRPKPRYVLCTCTGVCTILVTLSFTYPVYTSFYIQTQTSYKGSRVGRDQLEG